MSKELIIPKEHAAIYEAKTLQSENENCVRLYRNGPCTIQLQIRTFKSITDIGHPGKKRNMLAGVSLSLEELKNIVRFAKEVLK